MSIAKAHALANKFLKQAFPDLPIVFENAPMSKPKALPFLTVDFIPTAYKSDTLCADRIYKGLYSINIYTMRGTGTANATTIADDILDRFYLAHIESLYFKGGEISSGITTDNYYILNVSINYEMRS